MRDKSYRRKIERCSFMAQGALLLAVLTVGPLQAAPDTLTIAEKGGVTTANYPVQLGRPFVPGEIPSYPQALINGAAIPTQADIKQRWTDGSVKHAIISFLIPSLPANGSVAVTFQNQATCNCGAGLRLTKSQMLDPAFDFDAQMTLSAGVTGNISARRILTDWDGTSNAQTGPLWYWTEGPIATTVILADHTEARAYDVGSDGNRSFRPIFHATFWPGINKVRVRFIGEVANTIALQDQTYSLTLLTGLASPQNRYSNASITHTSRSRWTKEYWVQTAPSSIQIDHNFAYLISTKFVYNYDISKVPSGATIANYSSNWINAAKDLYNAGTWTANMQQTGGRDEIAPYPTWTTLWLYTFDNRMKDWAMGQAELSAAWPIHFREGSATRTGSTRWFDRTRSTPGIGHVVSSEGRPTARFDGQFIKTFGQSYDNVTPVGTEAGSSWIPEVSHMHDGLTVPYMLTGDFFFLEEGWFWLEWALMDTKGNISQAYGRGPTGSEGALTQSQLRGTAWDLRGRANYTFVTPDGVPEKTQFTTLLNDAAAIQEGGLKIMTSSFHGNANWNWGNTVQYPYYRDSAGEVDPLGNMNKGDISLCDPSMVNIALAGSCESSFEQWLMVLALGRATELGYPFGNVLTHASKLLINSLINQPAVNSYYIDSYRYPVTQVSDGRFFQTMASRQAAFAGATPVSLRTGDWQGGYPYMAMAAMSFAAGEPDGQSAWNWISGQLLSQPGLNNIPDWAIVPRISVPPPTPAAPAITRQPEDALVQVGLNASFGVFYTGYPLPTFQWQSRPPGASTFSPISGATSSGYIFPNAQLTDSGTQFNVAIINTLGSITSGVATLTVSASPVIIPPPVTPPGGLDWNSFTLKLPAFVHPTDQIQASYDSALPVDHLEWTFTPQVSGNVAAYNRASAASSAAVDFTTSASVANLAPQHLSLGAYQVTVKLFDQQGVLQMQRSGTTTLVANDLSGIHVYPNPWRQDKHAGKLITFDQLPVNSRIKLFAVSGRRIKDLGAVSGSVTWDLTNDSGDKVASGIYMYLITDSQGNKLRGKVAVVK